MFNDCVFVYRFMFAFIYVIVFIVSCLRETGDVIV